MTVKRLAILIYVGVIAHYPLGLLADEHENNDQSNVKAVQSILGPVSVGIDEKLKICTTDHSTITGPPSARPDETFWVSTAVEIFDNKDTSTPLPMEVSDLIFSRGQGGCAEIDGSDLVDSNPSSEKNSILVVLTSLAKARSKFSPLVTGQLSALGGGTNVGLLLPAVQQVREAPRGSGKTCCACAPVCGCGTCDN